MKHPALASIVIAASIAVTKPVIFVAQEASRAAKILSEARKAIGGHALESMKTFSVQSAVQRNVGPVQIASDVEILLELPDKYVRTEAMAASGGMMVRGGGTTGFSGDTPLRSADTAGLPGQGRMMIRIGPGGPVQSASGEKPTPEQLEQQNRAMLGAAKAEASRFMLGWFAMAHPAANASYSYVGEAESPDGKAYVLEVKNDTFLARLFVDESTHLPLMVTYKAPLPRVVTTTSGKGDPADAANQIKAMQDQPPEMGEYSIYFEDWRDADGVKFPFKIRTAVGGTTTEEWNVGKVKLNPRIDPRKFIGDGK